MFNIRTYYLKTLLILSLCVGGFVLPGYGQMNSTYFMADQLLQQRDYEKAYGLFEKLHRENPGTYIFFEKATECLINLKQYGKAIALAGKPTVRRHYPAQANIRLGEIYHVKGDTSQAFEVWDEVLENNSGNLQVYLTLARTMSERRVFNKAIEVYRQAIEVHRDGSSSFSGSPIVMTELANTHMQAGNYEKAVQTYLNLVKENPDRISHVQSTLLRFNDEYLYDVAILEINDFLENLSSDNPSHRSLHQLEIWLLMERGLYERALVTARNYEEQQSQVSYSLYGLGSKLLSERKFELAEKAFAYYVDNNISAAKYQSMEELANVYIEWADYLSDYNLAYHSRRDSLYQKAYATLKKITTDAPYYQNRNRVLVAQSELALDYLHDPVQVREYLTELERQTDTSYLARRAYLEGRIKLYQKEYSRARIAFTKSTRQERIGSLAEKTRYYLALTDFYAGDYEFAKIQLNALERQNTSYFANDAVQLRVWIQEGLQADSTGKIIAPFAGAVEHFSQGEREEAFQELTPLLQTGGYHPLTDEALLQLSSNILPQSVHLVYAQISRYLQAQGRYSPLRERLMWEKARIADQVVTNNVMIPGLNKSGSPDSLATEAPLPITGTLDKIPLPTSRRQLISLYEDLLMEYPQGFYATFVRNRIQELQKPQT